MTYGIKSGGPPPVAQVGCAAVELLFRQVVLGVVPQPAQIPPAPYSPEDLQRAYMDATQAHAYQQFQFLPGGTGAQFVNGRDDGVLIQPGLIQIRHIVSSTPEVARETVSGVLRAISKRLQISSLLSTGIKVVCHIPAPGSARVFVAEQLMQGAEAIDELGPSFFAGGVKYRSLAAPGQAEQNLLIEPFVQDDSFLYVDYDVQRPGQHNVDAISTWLDEAFAFVRGPALNLLNKGL